MKEKIIYGVIGFLLGLIIATGIFCIYNSGKHCRPGMNNNESREMFNGQNKRNGQMPSRPSGDNNSVPEKPNDDNTQSNNN